MQKHLLTATVNNLYIIVWYLCLQNSVKKVKAILGEAASILREPARKADVQAKLNNFQLECKHLGINV